MINKVINPSKIYFSILILFVLNAVSCQFSKNAELILDTPVVALEYQEDSGLLFAANSQSLYQISVIGDGISLIGNTTIEGINDIALGPDGNIFLATNNGLASFNPSTRNISNIENPILKNKRLSAVIAIERFIWVSIWGEGLVLFSIEDEISNISSTKLNTPTLINDISYYEGLIWIGTFGDGVLAINPMDTETEHWVTKSDGLISDYVFSISVHDTIMWIATYDGLSKISAKNIHNYNSPEVVKAEMMYSVKAVDDNTVLVGGAAGGPFLFCSENQSWNNLNLTSDPIYDIQVINNNAFIAGFGGLFILPIERMIPVCD
jgi:ligand-binding sensor domain-containing protein